MCLQKTTVCLHQLSPLPPETHPSPAQRPPPLSQLHPPPARAGKDGAGPEQREAALEGLLDLARRPGFVHAAFLSCDCRLERSDLLEGLCALAARAAAPQAPHAGGGGGGSGVGGGARGGSSAALAAAAAAAGGGLQHAGLQLLLAVMAALGGRLHALPPQHAPAPPPARFVDVWGPICRGEDPPLELLAAAASAGGGGEGGGGGGGFVLALDAEGRAAQVCGRGAAGGLMARGGAGEELHTDQTPYSKQSNNASTYHIIAGNANNITYHSHQHHHPHHIKTSSHHHIT